MGKRLVRDNARQHWVVPGAEHQLRPVEDRDEHADLLTAKLLEECGEVILANTVEDIEKELADVVAVLKATAHIHGIPWEHVTTTQHHRDSVYGGFTEGLVWETSR